MIYPEERARRIRHYLDVGLPELWTQSIGETFAITAEFDRLLYANGVDGPIAEIGVLAGAFFLALQNLTDPGTKSVAIDVFSDTDYQTHPDGIGYGRSERPAFEANLAAWGRPDDTMIVALDSATMDDWAGRPMTKMFSVDGCHCAAHAIHDIRLAAIAVMPGGLLIIDDYPHEAWPYVEKAAKEFLSDSPYIPIAVGYNKLWLSTHKYEVACETMVDVCGHETPKVGWVR